MVRVLVVILFRDVMEIADLLATDSYFWLFLYQMILSLPNALTEHVNTALKGAAALVSVG